MLCYTELMNFANKIVVVTGGSKGFGKALAELFIKEGSQVVITSTNKAELEATAGEIGANHFVADAANYEDVKALGKYINEKFGRIDVWVNNAGIQIAPSNTEDVDIEKLHTLFGINFFGYFYGCKVALKSMKNRGEGLIVNINSTAGLSGKPGLSAYVSSKFAIKGLSESVREELKETDIQLFQIFPGGMKTDIYHEKVPADIDEYMSVGYAIEKVAENFKSDNPEADLVIKRPTVS